jgi:DNA invertase Pin-like site-specific DNA recombinase
MSTNPFHLRMGARRTAVAAAALAVAAAAAVILPSAANAAGGRSKSVLAEGIGMHSHPSVRVRTLQRALIRHGYSVGPAGVDGRFGPRTRAAVRRAQRRHHVKVDGIVGSSTRRALGIGAAARAATTHRRRSKPTAHRAAAPAHPAAQPTPAPSRPSVATPAPAQLSTNRSGDALLIVVPLVAVIMLLFALAVWRQRRRRAERVAAYHLEAVPRPSHEDEVTATPTGEAEPPSPGGLAPGALVIGYISEPVAMAGTNGRSPERYIESACQRRGWQLVEIVRDREDGRILDRPSLSRALERIAEGEAGALVIDDARLLSRSADFATFVQWFRDAQAALIALDLGLDTSTPEGTRVANALITLNGWAGKWINSRTRRSLADLRPTVASTATRRLPASDRQEVLRRIAELVETGMSAEEVAARFNDERVPTLFGTEKWWPSSVHAGLRYWRAGSKRAAEAVAATERSSPL